MLGYGGEHCELSYSTCLSGPCLNGGLCIETMEHGYTCECMEGYYGDNCALIKVTLANSQFNIVFEFANGLIY